MPLYYAYNRGLDQSVSTSTFASKDESHSKAAHNEEDLHNCSSLKADYPNGNPRLLTTEERKDCGVFLPHLMGAVLASINCPKMKLRSVPLVDVKVEHLVEKSVIGFGVVGFKVYVVKFLCVRRDLVKRQNWSMHDIPCINGMGTDVLISEPLNLLKRPDRNKLFRLLSAIKSLDFKD